MGILQIDHVQPKAKGGSDAEDNLCLACELCNQYKWTKTEGLDPQNGETIALFNPRQKKWQEHFMWSDDGTEIIGLTACGRATVVAFRLNNSFVNTDCISVCRGGFTGSILTQTDNLCTKPALTA